MTRTSFQDDFDREVERQARETAATQVKPATDDLLDRLDHQLRGVPDKEIECITIGVLRSFFARIRAEQAEKAIITQQRDAFFSRLSDAQFALSPKEEEQ